MRNIKKFKSPELYNIFLNSDKYILPNLSLVSSNKSMHYEPKLYDCEIEYLEATGHQLIIVPFSMEYSVYCEYSWSNITIKQQRVFHAGSSTLYNNGNGKIAFARFNDWVDSNITVTKDVIYKFEYHRDTLKVYVEDTLKKTYEQNNEEETNECYIFSKSLGLDKLIGRIYAFKLYNADRTQIIHDFIPVRKGKTGYLYDKIEKKIYGDTVKEEPFILGDDIKHKIPNEYTILPYIQSTGEQYIDISNLYGDWDSSIDYGFWDVGSTYKIKTTFYSYSSGQTAQAALFAMGNDYAPTLYYNSNSGMYWKFPQDAMTYFEHISPGTLSSRQVSIVKHEYKFPAIIEYKCIAHNNDYAGWTPILFGRPTSTDGTATSLSVDRKIKAKLYSFKMYKDNNLIINFVPCKSQDNKVGLYETVNKKFLTSATNVDFIE